MSASSASLAVETGCCTATAAGAIRNDDALVSIAGLSASPLEGNSGTTTASFVLTLSGDTTVSHSVAYGVSGAGANPASADDFTSGVLPSGIVTFAIGETSKTISVLVAGDTTVEPDETYAVGLSTPSAGLTMGTATAVGTIRKAVGTLLDKGVVTDA